MPLQRCKQVLGFAGWPGWPLWETHAASPIAMPSMVVRRVVGTGVRSEADVGSLSCLPGSSQC